ncbi:MAG: hypothetical protein ABR922_07780 [Streptosporangiaceae bacterium]|jgi:hypothetical protein
MKAVVVHDERGQITAISKAVDLNQAGNKFVSMGVIPGEGQYALDVELTEELSGMRLSDIHQSYEVDRATSRLVKREHAITE